MAVKGGATRKSRTAAGHSPATERKIPSRPKGRTRKIGSRKGYPDQPPACIIINGEGSCPGWLEILKKFPMIDSVQREDFPAHNVSFVYLAHFYRTRQRADERERALVEFKGFFSMTGYSLDSSGDYHSRWFEGVGIKKESL